MTAAELLPWIVWGYAAVAVGLTGAIVQRTKWPRRGGWMRPLWVAWGVALAAGFGVFWLPLFAFVLAQDVVRKRRALAAARARLEAMGFDIHVRGGWVSAQPREKPDEPPPPDRCH